jgi:hypothetical protein
VWPWLGVALLLFGITSIGLAAASVGAGGAAAVGAAAGAFAARVRTASLSVAGITTRVRSKGLSADADNAAGRTGPRRGGIRYRE